MMDTIKKAAEAYGIDPALLAAVGLKESDFSNGLERGGGKGVGIFQIDLGQNPGVTKEQALDPKWASNWAAARLSSNMAYLKSKFPGFTADELLQATAASYNLGLGGISGNPSTTDVGTHGQPPDRYGANVLQLRECFQLDW